MTPGDGRVAAESFSEALRRLLSNGDGLSQRQLAARMAGTDATPERVESVRRQIVGWVGGEKVPNTTSVLWIAETLKISPDELLEARANSSVRAQVRQLADGLDELQAQLLELQDRVQALEDRPAS